MSIVRILRPFLAGALLLAARAPLPAEIVFTEQGYIVIGTIVKTEAGYSTYSSMGRVEVLKSSEIIRSESSLEALAGVPVQVELMNGSTLRGTISDFDPDIGLFLDISFGVITVPNASVKAIIEPKQRGRYTGSPAQVRAGASYYYPLGALGEDFSPDLRIEGMAAFSLGAPRGLSAGIDVAYSFAKFIPSAQAAYSFVSAEPMLSYRWLGLRTKSTLAQAFAPFLELGGGAVYVKVDDPSGFPPTLGELNPGAFAALGCDVFIFKELCLRLQGRFDAYSRRGSPSWRFRPVS